MAHIAIQQENKTELLKVSSSASNLFVLRSSPEVASQKEKTTSYLATKRNLLLVTIVYTVVLVSVLYVLL